MTTPSSQPSSQPPTRAQFDELLRQQRHANQQRGCLLGILFTLLFGVWYWLWLAAKWTAIWSVRGVRLSWRATVALGVWSVRASVAGYHVADRGARMLYRRYGVRGVAIAAGVLVLLVIVGALITTR